jgi:hypothetical protein
MRFSYRRQLCNEVQFNSLSYKKVPVSEARVTDRCDGAQMEMDGTRCGWVTVLSSRLLETSAPEFKNR